MSRRIGVEVSTEAIHNSTPPAIPGSGTTFFVGITERGPLDIATLVSNMTEFEAVYGGPTTTDTLWHAITVYFREGGAPAYIGRIAGTTPVLASKTLKDRAGAGGVNTLRVDATSKGVWGNSLKVAVADGTRSNTFKLTITHAITGKTLAERDNLASPAAAVTAFAGNRYVSVVNLASVTAAPTNNPVALAATALTGGDDDLDTVTDETPYITGLALFPDDLGAGAVVIPGQTASDVSAGIRAHCESTNDRIGLVSPALGSSLDAAKTEGTSVIEVGGGWVGLPFWPWVSYRDGQTTRWVDPAAFAAACRSRAQGEGAWVAAAASPHNTARFVSGTERSLTRGEVNDLTAAGINPIVSRPKVRLRGWFPQAESVDWPTLATRDLLNTIGADLTLALDEDAVWRNMNGEPARQRIINICSAYLDKIRAGGGLFPEVDASGREVDKGYVVTVTLEAATLNESGVDVVVAVRPAPLMALISVKLVKLAIGTAA